MMGRGVCLMVELKLCTSFSSFSRRGIKKAHVRGGGIHGTARARCGEPSGPDDFTSLGHTEGNKCWFFFSPPSSTSI